MPTFAYREAAKSFRDGRYKRIIAVGALRENGSAGGDQDEDFGIERLAKFGVPPDLVATASNSAVQRDRTYHSAIALKQWFKSQGLATASVDIVTVGAHARRSRLLYQEALGDTFTVGVMSIEDPGIDPWHWWRTSEGARTVITEAIGFVYARFFFSPQ